MLGEEEVFSVEVVAFKSVANVFSCFTSCVNELLNALFAAMSLNIELPVFSILGFKFIFSVLYFVFSSSILSMLSVSATKSPFNSPSLIAWYIALNIFVSSWNLTSNLAGWTFTSTFLGSISIFNTKNPCFPIVTNPLKACSAAPDKALSLTNLLFTKNNWLLLLDLEITGLPITPLTIMSSYV